MTRHGAYGGRVQSDWMTLRATLRRRTSLLSAGRGLPARGLSTVGGWRAAVRNALEERIRRLRAKRNSYFTPPPRLRRRFNRITALRLV